MKMEYNLRKRRSVNQAECATVKQEHESLNKNTNNNLPRKTRNIDLRTAEFKKKKKTKTTEVYNIDKANRLRAPAAAKLDTFARGAKGARDEPTYSRPGSPPPFVDNQERIRSTETVVSSTSSQGEETLCLPFRKPRLLDPATVTAKYPERHGMEHRQITFEPAIISDYVSYPPRYLGQPKVLPGFRYMTESEYDIRKVESNYNRIIAYKTLQTLALALIWFCMGISAEIVGPTLPDLKRRTGSNLEEIARSLTGKSIGGFSGCLFGGFLNEWYFSQVDLIICSALGLIALSCFTLPFANNVAAAFFIMAMHGFAEGIIGTGGNTLVMHMWREKAASPIQALHFAFGLGALLAPQLALPFLVEEVLPPPPRFPNLTNIDQGHIPSLDKRSIPDDAIPLLDPLNPISTSTEDMLSSTWGTTDLINATTEAPNEESKIEIAYALIGLMCLAVGGFAFTVFYKTTDGYTQHEKPRSFKSMLSVYHCSPETPVSGMCIIICLFVYFAQACGGERVITKFLFSYLVSEKMRMKKAEATKILMSFWAAFTCGRFMGIFTTRVAKLNLQIIMSNCMYIGFACCFLAIPDHVEIVWFATSFMGFFISTQFPNGMSWANLQLKINCVAVMFMLMGSSLGALSYQYAAGYLMEQEGPEALPSVLVACSVIMGASFAVMGMIGWRCHSPNFTRMRRDIRSRDEMAIPDTTVERMVPWHHGH